MNKKTIALSILLSSAAISAYAQHIEYEEYNLNNGLHVILQQDNSAPVVTTSVMYHVGSKDEDPNRTGFAHFFEHLLFEGTENIGRGEWFKLVSSNGGKNNAYTEYDRTYYYETFPSNNLQLALWMESERMLHPIINQIGVDTQNEVVKEEKRVSGDNRPYGRLIEAISSNLFKVHPYKGTVIGEMAHLDAATLDEFKAFFKKFYIPNNAVLIVAGDFDKTQAKAWINDYFAPIPKGAPIERVTVKEKPITEQINATFEDPNIQLPMYLTAFRTPSMKERDAYVLNMISTVLSDGKSSRLYLRMVDKDKVALETGAMPLSLEDYGMYIIYALPMPGKNTEDLLAAIESEVTRLQTELITEEEYTKLQNKLENQFVNKNSNTEGIARNLASDYLLYGKTNLINEEINIYRSVSREEIRDVAKKYLNTNQRLVLDYVPASK